MWLYFNNKGQLIEILEHGSPARSGTTDFEIFAYFEGVDRSGYQSASLKLRKPDLLEVEYPTLLMDTDVEKTFTLLENEHSKHFVNNQDYIGYYFNFADFNDEEDVAVLLDTPGLWKAIITLIGANRSLNVQGIATFLVANGTYSIDGTDIELETILNQIYTHLATKLNIKSDFYIKLVDTFVGLTEFDSSKFVVGDYVFNKATRKLYKIVDSLVLSEDNPEEIPLPVYFENIEGEVTDNAKLSAALDGKVNKSGDTMTGDLDFGNSVYGPKIKFANYDIQYGTGGLDFNYTSQYSPNTGWFSFKGTIIPGSSNTFNLGTSYQEWKDLYLSGSLKDETNSVAVSDIVSKKGGNTIGIQQGENNFSGGLPKSYSMSSGVKVVQTPQAPEDLTTKKYVDAQDTIVKDYADTQVGAEEIRAKAVEDALRDKIDSIEHRGRYLTILNAADGTVATQPETDEYNYESGDYFIVGTSGFYKPVGTKYVKGSPDNFVEGTVVANVNDTYYFDAASGEWSLLAGGGATSVSFGSLVGEVHDNAKLVAAFSEKQDVLTEGNRISIDSNNVISVVDKPYLSLERLGDYLYQVTFDTIPAYNGLSSFDATGCTSYVKDGKLYRNLDFHYANFAEFIVKGKGFEGMSFISGLNDEELEGKDDLIGQLPYRINDGRNESGLMVSTHVLYNDFNVTGKGEENVPITMLPYLVLTTMGDIDTLSDEVTNLLANFAIPASMGEYLIQVLVTDGTTTKLFAPTDDGDYEYIDITSLPKVTNFKWINKATLTRNDADLQLRPTGIERWNSIGTLDLEGLKFTECYLSANRLSEFIGIDDTTKNSTDEELEAIQAIAAEEYQTRTRNGTTWQTVHSVVYGDSGMESLNVQENYDKNYIQKPVDLSNYVDLTSAQTISGQKTLKGIYIDRISGTSYPYVIYVAGDGTLHLGKSVGGNNLMIFDNYIAPVTASGKSIGTQTKPFKDGYFTGVLKDDLGNSATVAQIVNGLFNVINASDIESTGILTQAQYDLITNGKPTRIVGLFKEYTFLTIIAIYETTSTFRLTIIGIKNSSPTYGMFQITKSNLTLSEISTDQKLVDLRNIRNINGKMFPNYPSSPTNDKVLTYKTDNTLSWEDMESVPITAEDFIIQ